MKYKNIEEVMKRRSELSAEIDAADNTRLSQIEEEMRELEDEEKKIRMRSALGKTIGANVPKGEEGSEDIEARQVKDTKRTRISAAAVKGFLKTRATTIASDSLATPTGAGSEIRENTERPSSIIDMVYVEDCTGCGSWEEAYEKTGLTAGTRVDGTAAAGSDPEFRVAKIMPYIVNVTAYVSKNIEKLTPIRYKEKVEALALKALRVKIVDLIINGVAGSFLGIKIAKNTKDEVICKTYTVSDKKIDEDTLKNIVFQYGGDDALGGSARLFLNKEDLLAFGKVRGTNEKKALYEITPDAGNANCGIIKEGGLIVPYCISSKLTALTAAATASGAVTMIYGDPKNFELGLFGEYEVKVSEDYKFGEGLMTIMGEVTVGGNVVVNEGFVLVKYATA